MRTTLLVAMSYPYQDKKDIGFRATISYENQNLLQVCNLRNKSSDVNEEN